MTKRRALPRVSGITISPLLMKKIEDVRPDTKLLFGGEKHGYKQRLVDFLDQVVQTGGEASAIARLGYSWWLYEEVKQKDAVFQRLVEDQNTLIIRRAEEMLYYRAMHGYEETVEEGGEIVKRTKKISERALLEFLKAHSERYHKQAGMDAIDQIPTVEITNFEVAEVCVA